MQKRKQQAHRGSLRSAFTFAFVAFVAILFFLPGASSFAGTDGYFYDELNRLIRVEYQNGPTVEYSYDAVGNRLIRQVTYPQRQITASAGSGGSISPSGAVSVNTGATATFTVTPDGGHRIDSVTGCGGTLDGNTYTTAAITADCSVSATFALNTYTVTASAGNGGSISPSGSVTSSGGTTQTFSLIPDAGYHAASASGCGGTLTGNTFTTGPITADCWTKPLRGGKTFKISV